MRVIMTGGGTGGHVIPNFAVIEELKSQCNDLDLLYVGSKNGVERKMAHEYGLDYKGISCGKLRRYWSWENFRDLLKVPVGILGSLKVIWQFKPQIVFSKGGYVSVPVVIAAWLLRVPVICHESDLRPGLANRISFPLVRKICLSFEESGKLIKQKTKLVITGNPIRKEIAEGKKEQGRKITGFIDKKPVLLVVGGSSGARQLNQLVEEAFKELTNKYQVIHVVGPSSGELRLEDIHYKQFGYIKDGIADIYALADVVISRGGANSLAELAYLKKKVIVIPLEQGSRGDQLENAEIYARNFGWAVMKGKIKREDLLEAIELTVKTEVKSAKVLDGSKEIASLIIKEAK